MKISEFAKLGNVSAKMLRHYDAIGLFSPASIDEENGYRLYTPEQLNTLHWIKALKLLDFSLDEIKQLLSGPLDSASFIEALANKRIEIDAAFKQALLKSMQIDFLLNKVKEEGFHMNRTIDLTQITQAHILDLKKDIRTLDMLTDSAKSIIKNALQGNAFGIYRIDMKQFQAFNDVDGYETGDKVIVALYQALESTLEGSELTNSVARSGGDEFAVFAEGSRKELERLALSIKKSVESIDYKALGCHQPIDVYIGCVIREAVENNDIAAFLKETEPLMREAHENIYDGGSGVIIKEK